MPIETQFAAITALDLGPIKIKLMHRQSGEGWSLAYTDAVAVEYRRFLMLIKAYPQEASAPQFAVDTFWHYHILDTLKYANDCEAMFGYFLHHYPYLGMHGEADAATHQRLGARNRELYLATFGDTTALDLLERGPHAYPARPDLATAPAGMPAMPRSAYSSNLLPAASDNASGAVMPLPLPLDATGLRAYAANMTAGAAGLTLDGITTAPQWQASEELRRIFAERPRLKRHD